MNRQQILEMCEDRDVELLLADGLDEAFIGYTDDDVPRAIYDKVACVQCLVDEGMSEEDAIEHLEFNTFYAYVGEQTPLFINYVL
jgi:hypothetical protein